MRALIRRHDWSATPLEAIGNWPMTLQSAVELILTTPLAMALLWGRDLALIYNDGFERLLGERHPRCLGAPVHDVWDDLFSLRNVDFDLVMQGERRFFPDRHALLEHEEERQEVWFDITLSPVQNDQGETAGVLVTGVDTTARVTAERAQREAHEALRKQERYFRALVRATSEIVFRMSPNWTEMRELQGRGFLADTTDPDGSWPQRYILPEDQPMVWDKIREVTATKSTFELEHRVRRADGSIGWVLSRAIPILDENGEILEWFGAATDITERRRTQEALRKFSQVIEQTASQVIITDLDGVIEYVNPHFTEANGYTAAEAIGQRPSLLKSGLTPEESYRDLWQTITAGRTWQGEMCNRRKDGTLYWEAAVISPIRDAEGRVTHYAGIKEDVTQRKQDAEVISRAQRLEAVGQLAASVAHDFNNLLSVVVANLELAERRLDDDKAKQMIRRSLEAAETGVNFNKRLLSLTRKRGPAPEPIDLNARVEAWATLLEQLFGPSVEIVPQLAPDLWRTRADRSEIDSVILNLAANARDAMPEGGRVVIETANETLTWRDRVPSPEADPGDYVRLSFVDSGVGMSEEVRSRAREPFFTTKEAGGGTGLGLSGVERFATQAGGFVRIRSRPGEGAKVSIYLPRLTEEALAQPAVHQGASPLGAGELVLLVEDNDRLREVTGERLETLGYDVIAAADGAQALSILEGEDEVDLVFSDIVMPGRVSGHDLVEWTRANRPGTAMLLTTAYDDAAQQPPRDEDAPAPLLAKPHSLAELARALRDALDMAEERQQDET